MASPVLLSMMIEVNLFAAVTDDQVCDVAADYALGIEDYSEAIRRHVQVMNHHPKDAVAYYHLGFALGMAGSRTGKIREYLWAEALGLTSWDSFLNFGLVQLENGDLDAAIESLRRAVLFGENHSESHFNLALFEERHGKLADTEQEIRALLTLSPEQPDARNLLGVINAQEGHSDRAYLRWRQLEHDLPDYEPRAQIWRSWAAGTRLPLARRRA
jgi:Flp pilus assembly protein TadD